MLGRGRYVFCHFISVFYNPLKRYHITAYGVNGKGDSEDSYFRPMDPIDFGSFQPNYIDCGSYYCCTVSTAKTAKCWGRVSNGALGQGDGNNRGNNEGEMGDNLKIIDLGHDFFVDDISCGHTHTCALSTDLGIKCMYLSSCIYLISEMLK